jgi:hypothetical protein
MLILELSHSTELGSMGREWIYTCWGERAEGLISFPDQSLTPRWEIHYQSVIYICHTHGSGV